ncbi:hypothetical protein BKA65DRAFT_459224 [Rhexocercosporidium sp. MPI-PUGE-AT-0058]|nr:hypothetical protein BKA65DRAFT_459224 [Rhexocercosporidium sp. MPI-PUGE-AT-0058]
MLFPSFLAAVLLLGVEDVFASSIPKTSSIPVPGKTPADAGKPWQDFFSYSIEASSFADFAGNLSTPNTFSYNLLKNLKEFAGVFPVMRIGGNTQDQISFDPKAKFTLKGTMNTTLSSDYPVNIIVGPTYYEAYQTWPGVRFVHGFNLGNQSVRAATIALAPYLCKILKGRVDSWEMGNEPDLFWLAGQRAENYTESEYVSDWRAMRRDLKAAMSCNEPFMAPSFAGLAVESIFKLSAVTAWKSGLDVDKDISRVSQHNYMGVATAPGVTLQATLMNHTAVKEKVAALMNYSTAIKPYTTAPYMIGEYNSLARQGKPGISNSFGAALWGLDFNLWMATQGVKRGHMHQGTNYRYQAWQPIQTNITTKGTKAPYYGNIAVAAFLGGIDGISNLPVASELSAAYAGYARGGRLKRVMAINMQQYNASAWNEGFLSNYSRPIERVTFDVGCSGVGSVRRLLAEGSDSITGIAFDGYSYNWELDNGKPVLMRNITRGETVYSRGGKVAVEVPFSSAAIVDLHC